MAKRKAKHIIDKKAIVEAFVEMAKSKNIDKDLLQGILEETLSMLVKRKFGNNANFEIIVNMDKGDIEIYLIKEVAEEVADQIIQISLEEANKYSDEPLEVGDEFIEEITLDNIADNFGRRLVTFASVIMNSKIREVERDNLFNEYVEKVGDIVTGEIYQIQPRQIIVVQNKVEMKLPREEQIPNVSYRKNNTIRAIIKEVRRNNASIPEIILSRASTNFLAKLLELEVPEIYDGIIAIRSIAREAGERSKVAVESADDRVDPIGACVGMKGVRIQAVVNELNGEIIDLIHYSPDIERFIANALLPAKVKEISISEDTKTATVIVPEDQVSLAIGKGGQNVRLASQLTGYLIKLLKEGGEDIEIQEFETEMGSELIELLKERGIITARDFLDTAPEDLLKIEGLDYISILGFRKIMLIEFDEREDANYVNSLKSAAGLFDDENFSAEKPQEIIDEQEDINKNE